jgi:predicted NBD/HSP70 family sugar kinase
VSQPSQPGTPRLLRAINDRAALELLLERGPLTRAQLGELTRLSKVTASQLVERLEGRGLVTRVGETTGGRGPNAQLYAIVPGSAYAIGVEVGPRQVVAAAADITGATRSRVEVSPHDADDPVGVVHAAVIEAATTAGAAWEQVRRVVLGTPGVVDPTSGDLSFAFDLPQWHRGLLAALRADLRRPVVFENDVNLAAVAESRLGAARDTPDFALIMLSRGVGMAVMLGGRLHRGAAGAAGEIGYLPVPGAPVAHEARTAKPGGLRGSFQRTVGAESVRELARQHGLRASTAEHAIRAAISGGTDGDAALDELARRVALGVAAVCTVIDPSLVVLGGEVGRAGGTALAERVHDHIASILLVPPPVVPTELGTDSVLQGALLTGVDAAREELFAGMADLGNGTD